MTKLYTEELVKYFDNIRKELSGSRPLNFDDYLFPEELTAEFIANKFGISRVAALRKLKQLEEDNFLVSKRANVVGKPGKRLVFFKRAEVIHPSIGGPSDQMPYSRFGARDLLFEKYSRKFNVQETGDALLTLDIIVKNVSHRIFEDIPLPKIVFDTYDTPNVFDSLKKVEVNGKEMPYSSEGLLFYKKSKPGYVDEVMEPYVSNYYSEVVYVVPLDENMMPGDITHIRLVTMLPSVYKNCMQIEHAGLEIYEFTMQAHQEVIAPKGYSIRNLKRYENRLFKRGVMVKDVMSEMRKTELEEEVNAPRATRRSLKWTLDKPAIGYRYIMPFCLVKN